MQAILTACFTMAGLYVASGHEMTANAQATNAQDQDPADANLAPVDQNAAQQQQQAPPPSSGVENESQQRADEYKRTGQQAGAPADANQQQAAPQGYPQDQNYPQQQGYPAPQATEQQVDAGQAALEANEPPPQLPEYDQPSAPAPNYIWTPGYWYYAPPGYYWVPGVWVLAPYPGALWTPGYWGWYGHRYRWYHGYWGLHIGFYGGVNYGYGYTGYGYYGGYWNGSTFFYNTAVNRVNVRRVTTVYNRAVVVNNYSRVAYNGGRGGIQVQPRPAEVVGMREARTPQMSTQVQNRHEASQNGAQYYQQNQGRPGLAATPRAAAADPGIARPQSVGHQYTGPTQPYITPVPHYPQTAQPQYRPQGIQPQPHSAPRPQSQPRGQESSSHPR